MKGSFKIVASLNQEDLQHEDLNYADILEIRLDLFHSELLIKNLDFLKKSTKPLLFCYRDKKDSSIKSDIVFDKNHEIILRECESSNNFIDIELDQINPKLNHFSNLAYQKLYSYHNFHNIITLNEMNCLIKDKIKENQTAIFKFAVFPKNLDDSIQFLKDIKSLSKHYKVIGICMGETNLFSRIFSDFFGSIWTYACVKEPKAPGQISIKQILSIRDLMN